MVTGWRDAPLASPSPVAVGARRGSASAIAVGGYSPRSASVGAARLLKNAKVRAEIDRKLPSASFARTREKLRPQSRFSATRLRPAAMRSARARPSFNFNFSVILP